MGIFSKGSHPGASFGYVNLDNNTVNSTVITAPQVLDNVALISYEGNDTLAGIASDSDDLKLTIEYKYGGVVSRRDLWTSVLDGMATAAQYDAGARCTFITAVSISGNLVFHVNEVSNHILSCDMAMKTFCLVALISIRRREYKEQKISLFHNERKFAEGYVLNLGKAALEGGGEPISNE